MRKDIRQIYKHSQSQLSKFSLKTPVSSSSENQTYPAIELTRKSETKVKTILFCIPKIPSIMMKPSQTMTTYSLVRQQKKFISFQTFQHLIIIHKILLPNPQVD